MWAYNFILRDGRGFNREITVYQEPYRLNNHMKDIKKPNAIEACKHFNNNEHTSVNMANS